MDTFTRKLVIRYTIVFVVVTILVSIVGYFLQRYTSGGLHGGLGIVPVLVASLEAGQHYYRQKSELPSKQYAWRMAALFTAVAVLISAGMILVLAAITIPGSLFNAGDAGMMFGFVIGIAVVYLVAARFFFGFGAKNLMKAKPR